jgi:hypothetical protein
MARAGWTVTTAFSRHRLTSELSSPPTLPSLIHILTRSARVSLRSTTSQRPIVSTIAATFRRECNHPERVRLAGHAYCKDSTTTPQSFVQYSGHHSTLILTTTRFQRPILEGPRLRTSCSRTYYIIGSCSRYIQRVNLATTSNDPNIRQSSRCHRHLSCPIRAVVSISRTPCTSATAHGIRPGIPSCCPT